MSQPVMMQPAPGGGYGTPEGGYVNYGATTPPQYPGPPGAPPGSVQVPPGYQPGLPAGLEYLTHLDQVIVKQQIELLEALTGWEQANKYVLFNSMGQQMFFAAEESNLCLRQLCGSNRGFQIHIMDLMGKEVIRVQRDFKCCAGCNCLACCDACAFSVEVQAPVGEVVGYIRQECSFIKPHYSVRSADDHKWASIHGPCCHYSCICCPDIKFTIENEDQEIGRITKKWTGVVSEMFTDADTFNVSFPQDMDVRAKATFVAAVFLIDFMYFETTDQND